MARRAPQVPRPPLVRPTSDRSPAPSERAGTVLPSIGRPMEDTRGAEGELLLDRQREAKRLVRRPFRRRTPINRQSALVPILGPRGRRIMRVFVSTLRNFDSHRDLDLGPEPSKQRFRRCERRQKPLENSWLEIRMACFGPGPEGARCDRIRLVLVAAKGSSTCQRGGLI